MAETCQHSSADKRMHETVVVLLLLKSGGSVLSFDILHVQILIKQKCWRWLPTFFKNAGRERVKLSL